MAESIIGDIKDFVAKENHGVVLHRYPRVLATELADIGDTINDKAQSGKRLGARVMAVTYTDGVVTTAGDYTASGSDTDSPWVLTTQIVGTGSAATVTPA